MTGRDIDIAIQTLLLEGRGERMHGQLAIAHVLVNRRADEEFPDTLMGVCLQRNQFEGWWPRSHQADENLRTVLSMGRGEHPWVRAAAAVHGTLAGLFPDVTGGALWYKAIGASAGWHERMVAEGVLEPTRQVGGHRFYGRAS